MSKTIQMGSPKTSGALYNRALGVRDSLLAAYRAGIGSPNQVAGNEREIFLHEYLEAAYPKPFRFATGFVVDKEGNQSGQLDIVAEKMNSISFPAQSASNQRLFLAELVSAVISVKSNLFSQWNQVVSELEKLQPVQSQPGGTFKVNVREGNIPFFVIAYSGAKDAANLQEKLRALPENNCLQAVLVLDANILAIQTRPGDWVFDQTDSSFLYFVCQLHDEITRNFAVGQNIWEYACEVTTDK